MSEKPGLRGETRMNNRPIARVFLRRAAMLSVAVIAASLLETVTAEAVSLGYGPFWFNLGGYSGRGHHRHYSHHPHHSGHLRHGHHGHHAHPGGAHGHGGSGGGHAPMSPL